MNHHYVCFPPDFVVQLVFLQIYTSLSKYILLPAKQELSSTHTYNSVLKTIHPAVIDPAGSIGGGLSYI